MNLNDMMSASTLKEIAKKTGATPEEVKNVLGTALPVLVQTMANNAKSGEGAQSLGIALSQHAASNATVKGVDPADGVKILKHVLGGDVKAANKSIAKQSGVNAATAAGILAMAAPLLMNALGKEKEDSKTSNSGLAKLLLSLLGNGGSAGILGALLGGGSSNSKKDDEGDLLGSLLGAFTGKDDDDDDDSILDQVGSLAAGLAGSGGKKGDDGLAGLLLNMLKSK